MNVLSQMTYIIMVWETPSIYDNMSTACSDRLYIQHFKIENVQTSTRNNIDNIHILQNHHVLVEETERKLFET